MNLSNGFWAGSILSVVGILVAVGSGEKIAWWITAFAAVLTAAQWWRDNRAAETP